MRFMSKNSPCVAGEGAIVYLDADELALVDLVIKLHAVTHKRIPSGAITDPERAEMLTLSILMAGRALTGWTDRALIDRAREAREQANSDG